MSAVLVTERDVRELERLLRRLAREERAKPKDKDEAFERLTAREDT